MSTTVVTVPEKEINSNPLTVSKWNAINHPIKFELKREDYLVTSVPLGGSLVQITSFGGFGAPASTIFAVGKFVYIENFIWSGNFEIDSIIDPDIIIVKDPDGIATFPAGGGFMNDLERANFFIETSIYDKSSGSNVFLQTSINKPDAKGIIEVDVSSFLKDLVGYVDGYDYTATNQKDLTLSGIFNIEYKENWFGFEGPNNVHGIDYYFTNSAKQLGDLYGSNMGEYVPDVDVGAGPLAKFLTSFEKPTYFPDFPYSLDFIHGLEMTGIDTRVFIKFYNINGINIFNVDAPLDITQKPFINRLKVAIGSGFADSATYQIRDNGIFVTEAQPFIIDSECKDFPIYLTWLNPLGGYDSWLFFKTNKYKVSTRLENKFLKNVDDLETSIGNIDITGKTSSPQVDFGARVKAEDMRGMQSLFESPKVLYLTNPETWVADGPKWQRVIIRNGNLLVEESRNAFEQVKLSMLLPTRNTQKE